MHFSNSVTYNSEPLGSDDMWPCLLKSNDHLGSASTVFQVFPTAAPGYERPLRRAGNRGEEAELFQRRKQMSTQELGTEEEGEAAVSASLKAWEGQTKRNHSPCDSTWHAVLICFFHYCC